MLNNSKIFSKHLLYTHVSYFNRVSISMFSISMLHTSMIWRVDAGPGPLMLILSSTSSHRQALLFLVTCRLLVLSGIVVQWIKALVICRSLSFWYIMSSAVVCISSSVIVGLFLASRRQIYFWHSVTSYLNIFSDGFKTYVSSKKTKHLLFL